MYKSVQASMPHNCTSKGFRDSICFILIPLPSQVIFCSGFFIAHFVCTIKTHVDLIDFDEEEIKRIETDRSGREGRIED